MRRKLTKFFTALIVTSISLTVFPVNESLRSTASADNLTALQQQLSQILSQEAQYNQQIAQDEAKSQQLAGSIQNLSQKIQADTDLINQKEQLISANQQQINLLTQSITQYEIQIDQLGLKITQLQGQMDQRAKKSYEDTFVSPFQLLFNNPNITDAVTSIEYFNKSRDADVALEDSYNQSAAQLASDKQTLVTQQASLQTATQSLQDTEAQLASDKQNLTVEQGQMEAQKSQADKDISNSQGVLNSLQNQAAGVQSQIAYIKHLTGGSAYNYPQCGHFGGYSDSGWYANQLCSPVSLVREVGCLATDLSMLNEYYNGFYMDPYSLMDHYSGMLTRYPTVQGSGPSVYGSFLGYGLNFNSYKSTIDNLLNNGTPVIVGMWPVYGGSHFVVLIKPLPGGDYLINNPAGNHPDETLNSDGFNTSLIHEIIYY